MTYDSFDQPIREARLRPESAKRFPWAPAGTWLPASRLADLAMTQVTRQGHGVPRSRILPDDAFEFRGGRPEAPLRRRAHTRWSDQVYSSSATPRRVRV